MSADLYVVVASHLGTEFRGGLHTRDEAMQRFDAMLAEQAASTERPDLYDPWSDTSLRVVSARQWQGSEAIRARQEVTA